MEFFIAGADEDASVSVSVEGVPVESTPVIDGKRGYKGRFVMPELGGASRPVYVLHTVEHYTGAQGHEDGIWDGSFQVQYKAPASAPAPPADQPLPAPTAPAQQPVTQQTPATTGSTPGTTGSPSPGGGGSAGAPPAGGPGSAGGPNTPASPGGHGGSPLPLVGAVTPAERVADATERVADATERVADATERVAAEEPAAESTRSAPETSVAPERVFDREPPLELPTSQPTAGDPLLPVPVAIALAIGLLLGVGGAGIAVARRRHNDNGGPLAEVAPPVPPDLVEAELQEMIAERRHTDSESTEDGDRVGLVTIRDGPG